MKPYRFVGSEAEIGGYGKLERFGQRILLPEAVASQVAHAARLIPEEAFLEIGFTDQELRDYQYAGSHVEATPDFLAKKARAINIYQGRA